MMRYGDVRDFVTAGLNARGYGMLNDPDVGPTTKPMPSLDPGPSSVTTLQDKYTQSVVFLTVGNGSGMTVEEAFDLVFITVRVVGVQGSYDYAEQLALDVDQIMLAVGGNALVGSTLSLRISRTGGPPQLVDLDSGNRYHFQNTYIAEAIH